MRRSISGLGGRSLTLTSSSIWRTLIVFSRTICSTWLSSLLVADALISSDATKNQRRHGCGARCEPTLLTATAASAASAASSATALTRSSSCEMSFGGRTDLCFMKSRMSPSDFKRKKTRKRKKIQSISRREWPRRSSSSTSTATHE